MSFFLITLRRSLETDFAKNTYTSLVQLQTAVQQRFSAQLSGLDPGFMYNIYRCTELLVPLSMLAIVINLTQSYSTLRKAITALLISQSRYLRWICLLHIFPRDMISSCCVHRIFDLGKDLIWFCSSAIGANIFDGLMLPSASPVSFQTYIWDRLELRIYQVWKTRLWSER